MQTDHSEVYEVRSHLAAQRTEVEDRSRAITRQISGPATLLQVTDLFFRPLFAFFIIELKTRRVIHVGVTRSPTDAWVARTAARSYPVWASAEVSDT